MEENASHAMDNWDSFFDSAHKLAEDVERMQDFDPVDKPRHYANKSIEVIDYIEDTVPDVYSFYMGNVLKYVSRHLNKSGKQDLLKARFYLEKMIDEY